YLDLLGSQLRLAGKKTGHIPARPRKSLHVAMQERIEIVRPHDNWNRAACRKRGFHGDFRPRGPAHVHVGAPQLGRTGAQPAGLPPRGAELDDQIAAIDETTLAQFVPERRIAEPHNSLRPRRADGKAAKEPDAINAPGLLRPRRERPRSRPAEKRC